MQYPQAALRSRNGLIHFRHLASCRRYDEQLRHPRPLLEPTHQHSLVSGLKLADVVNLNSRKAIICSLFREIIITAAVEVARASGQHVSAPKPLIWARESRGRRYEGISLLYSLLWQATLPLSVRKVCCTSTSSEQARLLSLRNPLDSLNQPLEN
jgi:hypothetical protein